MLYDFNPYYLRNSFATLVYIEDKIGKKPYGAPFSEAVCAGGAIELFFINTSRKRSPGKPL